MRLFMSISIRINLATAMAILITCFCYADSLANPAHDALRQAESLIQQRKYVQALNCLDKAISLNPNNADAYWTRTYTWSEQAEWEKVIADCSQVIRRRPKAAWAYAVRGKAREHLGFDKGADCDLRKAIQLNDNDANLFAFRAIWYQTNRGLYKEAVADYTRAINLKPKWALLYAGRAVAQGHLGHQAAAQVDWAKAAALDSKLVQGHLGNCRNRFDDNKLACEKFIVFVNPGDATQKKWLPEVSNLESWSLTDKQIICSVFCNIRKKAPGLVARACDGQKIKLVMPKRVKDRSGMDTAPAYVSVYPGSFAASVADLEWMLTHELAHVVDVCDYLSNGRKWNQVAVPFIAKYRENYAMHGPHAQYYKLGNSLSVDPLSARFGIPTRYSATNTAEALADSAAAMIVVGWAPPPSIRLFILDNLIADSAVRPLPTLLRQACEEEERCNHVKAIGLYTDALKIDPTSATTLLHLSRVWKRYGQPELSRIHGRNGLRQLLDDGAPPFNLHLESGYGELADSYYDSGEFEQAIHDYTQQMQVSPFSVAQALEDRASAYLQIKQNELALKDATRAIGLVKNPSVHIFPPRSNGLLSLIYNTRAGAHRSLGHDQRAVADYTQAIKLYPKHQSYYDRGLAFMSLRSYSKAVSDFSKAISMDSTDASLYYYRGVAHYLLGNFRSAIADCSAAIKLNGQDDDVYCCRANVYQDCHKQAEALADYNKAISINPKEGKYYFFRGKTYERLGKAALAKKDRQLAHALGYKERE